MAEEIEIIVTATGFDKVSSGLKNTNDALKSTATEAKKTGDALKSNLNAGAAQAGQSITNLSRIAQDAPFGFIGIANNINPLVESFGRLKAETGSTGGALKALVAGLSGPAGLGLAFGVVTAAISFAQMGLQAWSKGSKQAKNDNDEFEKSLQSAKTSAISTGLQLQAFIDVAKNGKLPLEQRNEALKQANEILGKHGELLTLTNVGTEQATQQVKLYTQALIAQAVAGKYADRLAELAIKRTTINNRLGQLQNGIDRIRAVNAKSAVNQLTGQTAGYVQLQDALVDQVNTKAELNAIDQEYNQTLKDLNNSVLTSTSSFGQLGTKVSTTAAKVPKAKKALETFNDVIVKTAKNIKDQEKLSILLDESTIKEQISIIRETIERGIKEFNVPTNDARILKLKAQLDELEAQLAVQEGIKHIKKAVKNQKGKLTIKVPVIVNPDAVIPVAELQKKLQESFAIIGTGLGEGIANAITEGANFGDVFLSIFNQLGGVVQALGQQILAIGIAAIVAADSLKAIFANPYAAIAAGIALVALGALIKNTTTPRNRFAVGTRNAPGGMALVGERGPEMISLPRGSQVLPAAQTANMLGGASGAVEIYGILRGQDIYFSNKKYSATYARTT